MTGIDVPAIVLVDPPLHNPAIKVRPYFYHLTRAVFRGDIKIFFFLFKNRALYLILMSKILIGLTLTKGSVACQHLKLNLGPILPNIFLVQVHHTPVI